jgi:hypothetical protein
VVTPQLAKLFETGRFAGDNTNMFDEGLHPLNLTIRDQSTEASENATRSAENASAEHDELARGGSERLSDLRELRSTARNSLPRTFGQLKAQYRAYRWLLLGALGSMHPVYVEFLSFLRALENRDDYYSTQLNRLRVDNGPLLMARFTMLQCITWFRAMRSHTSIPPLPAPRFRDLLDHLTMESASWVPRVPERYLEQRRVDSMRPSSNPKLPVELSKPPNSP